MNTTTIVVVLHLILPLAGDLLLDALSKLTGGTILKLAPTFGRLFIASTRVEGGTVKDPRDEGPEVNNSAPGDSFYSIGEQLPTSYDYKPNTLNKGGYINPMKKKYMAKMYNRY